MQCQGPDIVAFLAELKQQLGGPFTVIWDGSNIHSRSRLVKAYLAKHPELVAETLPSYAPELNPDEGVWGWSKYGRLANFGREHRDFGNGSTRSLPCCEKTALCWPPLSKKPN